MSFLRDRFSTTVIVLYVIRNSYRISRGIKPIPSVKLYFALDGSMRRDATHHKVLLSDGFRETHTRV